MIIVLHVLIRIWVRLRVICCCWKAEILAEIPLIQCSIVQPLQLAIYRVNILMLSLVDPNPHVHFSTARQPHLLPSIHCSVFYGAVMLMQLSILMISGRFYSDHLCLLFIPCGKRIIKMVKKFVHCFNLSSLKHPLSRERCCSFSGSLMFVFLGFHQWHQILGCRGVSPEFPRLRIFWEWIGIKSCIGDMVIAKVEILLHNDSCQKKIWRGE